MEPVALMLYVSTGSMCLSKVSDRSGEKVHPLETFAALSEAHSLGDLISFSSLCGY